MAQATEQEQAGDIAAARRSFLHFLLHYVYILEPPPGRAVIKWEPWPYLVNLAKELVCLKLLVILKGRQLGLSWLLGAYALWTAIFHRGALVLLLSQGQDEARELLRKVKFIHGRLPDSLKATVTKDNESEMEFGGLMSAIRALPSTEKAGAGYTATLVIADEHAKHPYAATNYAALEPTINAGAQFISVSTAHGLGNFFHQLYDQAKKGLNGFAWRFLHAMLRPGRDEAWYENTRTRYKGLPHLFPQEYPRADTEAFALTAGICAFDLVALQRLRDGVLAPTRQETYPLGYLRVWREPQAGKKYVCGCDVAYGLDTPTGGVAQVIEWQTGMHAASLWGHFPPEELAEKAVALCRHYHNAFLGLEANGVGLFAVRRVQELGYGTPTHFYHRDYEKAVVKSAVPKEPGWMTTALTRPVLVAELAEAIRSGFLVTNDTETIGEMGTFIIENNRPDAAPGCRGDRVMALGIGWQMRQLARLAAVVPEEVEVPSVVRPRPFFERRAVGTRSFMSKR